MADTALGAAKARSSTRRPRERAPAAAPAAAGRRALLADGRDLGAPAQWEAHLRHCAGLGFDAVVLASPFAHAGDDPLLVADYARLDPALGWGDDADAALRRLAACCRAERIALWLDLAPDVCSAAHPWVERLPGAYVPQPGSDALAPPDPRRPARAAQAARLLVPAQALPPDDVVEAWTAQLRHWQALGVAGFRCLRPQALPAAFWHRLTAAARRGAAAPAFAAWTPGLTPAEVAALEGAFDAVYSSLPWWDFRAGWLLEEHERLGRVGAVVAPLAAPGAADDGRALLRRLRFAAAFADGLLAPWPLAVAAAPELVAGGARDEALPPDGWREAVIAANALLAARAASRPGHVHDLGGGDAPWLAWLLARERSRGGARVLLANRDLERITVVPAAPLLRHAGCARLRAETPDAAWIDGEATITLEPGAVLTFAAEPLAAVGVQDADAPAAELAARRPRIVVERPAPCVDEGRFAVKRTLGERVHVEVDAYDDGHGVLAVELLWKAADARTWKRCRMRALGNDRWAAEFPLERLGRHVYTVQAWRDAFATACAELRAKQHAGVLAPIDVEEAHRLVDAAAERQRGSAGAALRAWRERLAGAEGPALLEGLLDPALAAAMAAADAQPFLSKLAYAVPVDAERLEARYASWYELFPRSQAREPGVHGTLADVIARLPAIRAMGFDVLYLPPIHPIGRTHRKGRNNALQAGPDDPGSPYAIGAPEGGHDAVHPALGTLEDFERLVAAAAEHGLLVALDFAVQCSPDHPWLREHPEWFAWRADGSLRYAENPPKKYEDIVNVDFYAPGAVPSLWNALRDVVLFWVARGVRLFRVDNPHTKPFAFWEWLIRDVRSAHPDVVFLSEAFTRPKPMYRLAKLGFSQSYTYFTWRHGKDELTAYFQELTQPPVADFFRPLLFTNTPDINPFFLQGSGRPGFLIRAALAATLSGLWGVYSGFELCESAAVAGREEYLDSEKYELKARDWNAPGNIVAEIARLNAIRRANPALQDALGLRFLDAPNGSLLCFRKATAALDNVVLVVVNLDPFHAQEADVEVPLWEWQLPDDAAVVAEDLMRGRFETWRGRRRRVRLDPADLPFAIWRIRPEAGPWT